MAEIASAIIKSIVLDIDARVAAAHNELHKEEVWVHHLYNDGEITMEKGADLYGYRNRHVHTSGCRFILQKGFRFPIPARNNSYAILSEKECIAFRAEMVDLC
jgi:hypothetical protein